ncbi:hypothetical protein SGFS_018350 [Streptomyces graminofaciens]|uniref:Uncharacterized protein n=1 Tax=Streptomyces graminofaciens TaxID=68212 RepID=A0ABM7F424_9ACTN|nr:hypothetical protein SGFS_018350 [Streptomyces graminofaciens]
MAIAGDLNRKTDGRAHGPSPPVRLLYRGEPFTGDAEESLVLEPRPNVGAWPTTAERSASRASGTRRLHAHSARYPTSCVRGVMYDTCKRAFR